MASNPYVNKVEYEGQTLMDLTGDTVTANDVRSGVTFHDRSGAAQQGGLIISAVYDGLDSTSTTDALSANQGKVLDGKISGKLYCKTLSTGANITSITIGTENIDIPYLIVWQSDGGIGAAICARRGKAMLNLSSVYTISAMTTSGSNITLTATGLSSARIWVACGFPINSLSAA